MHKVIRGFKKDFGGVSRLDSLRERITMPGRGEEGSRYPREKEAATTLKR